MLHFTGNGRVCGRDATRAAFPLGGIGTGNVSIGARGELRDWEIWNKPGKGSVLPCSFFALWLRAPGLAPEARILAGRPTPPFDRDFGHDRTGIAGLPHFQHSRLLGEYPFVQVELWDEGLPVTVKMQAFTPLIPLEPEESGLPGAIIHYVLSNSGQVPLEVSVAGSLTNGDGFDGYDSATDALKTDYFMENTNSLRREGGLTGIDFRAGARAAGDPKEGSMVLAASADDVSVKPAWFRGRWWTGLQDFWDDFLADGRLSDLEYIGSEPRKRFETGSLACHALVPPGEEKIFSFYLTWYFPKRPASWQSCQPGGCGQECAKTVRNHYAAGFTSAWDVASYLYLHRKRLEDGTQAFHDALFSSTLPEAVIDAAASNIAVLRSTTCFWLEDGTFLGYEGCSDRAGCCPGNCTHVWNYAQTGAFLFPSLERNMREREFIVETDAEGLMNFRGMKVFDEHNDWYTPGAVDGQLGCLMRLYRDWKFSGDHDFLARLWPKAKQALDYAVREWDPDGDGIIEVEQHNTYDISFFGPNMLTGAIFVGALRAAGAMAEAMGDKQAADTYAAMAARSAETYDRCLWNGEYYKQLIDDPDGQPFQCGEGCLSDQLFGQTLAHLYGLGDLLPKEHLRGAISSVFRHNYRSDLSGHHNTQRVFALNDEGGLLLCSWPRGGRPRFPFVYADEIWTGIEYQAATEMIYQGLIDEGITVVATARARYDGTKRNPWDEIECGHHYVRSMASWGPFLALTGFRFDLPAKVLHFAPAVKQENFSCLWTCGSGWGVYRQQLDAETGSIIPEVRVLGGTLDDVQVVSA